MVTFSLLRALRSFRTGENGPATRRDLMPISEVCSNPSRVSKRARRFVPLLGMELATILIR
jgi:hypothetical protein